MGLTRKILLFTSLLVVVLVAVSLAYSTVQAERLADENIRAALAQARQVWETFEANQYGKLKLGVRVLGNEPYFKAAVQTGDAPTVADMLQERGQDLAADFFIATDAAGRVVARSDAADGQGADLSTEPLVARALEGAEEAGIWRQDERLYQAVSVPMAFGSDLIGTLVAGFRIDAALAGQMSRLVRGKVAYLTQEGAVSRVAVTSLGGEEEALRATLSGAALPKGPSAAPFELKLNGDRHLAVRLLLQGSTADTGGSLLVIRSVAEEMAAFRRFRAGLVTASVVVLALALGIAFLAASRITGPLRALVGLVERVRDGSYTGSVTIDSRDEIGALASAFDRMREGIAAREEHIRRMALQDPLTGLPNRALFGDRLQQALSQARREGRPVSVLIVDLDRFKDVNDSLGHDAGDHVLREVAVRLQGALRASDTVARFGGDEFAVLLPGAPADEARRLARRLIDGMRRPVEVEGQHLHIGASIGVAAGPHHGTDPATLIRHADQAMFVAKKANSGFAIYDEAYEQRSQDRLWLMEDLHRAVERNELVLHYQPKVDLRTGRVAAAEALVRWMHPTRGLVGPTEFIPLAEQTGLIRPLTRWVMEHALRQWGEWRRANLDIGLCLNASARDLLGRDLPEVLSELARGAGVDPVGVAVEITESAMMEEPDLALTTLLRMRDMGLRISVDDFGTGYSSLAYLKRLPVHELKIDKSFVLGMTEGSGDEAIVRSVIELGHNMGLEVVAEGVETGIGLALLERLQCDLAQGFYLSRPLPADELQAWVASRGQTAAGTA